MSIPTNSSTKASPCRNPQCTNCNAAVGKGIVIPDVPVARPATQSSASSGIPMQTKPQQQQAQQLPQQQRRAPTFVESDKSDTGFVLLGVAPPKTANKPPAVAPAAGGASSSTATPIPGPCNPSAPQGRGDDSKPPQEPKDSKQEDNKADKAAPAPGPTAGLEVKTIIAFAEDAKREKEEMKVENTKLKDKLEQEAKITKNMPVARQSVYEYAKRQDTLTHEEKKHMVHSQMTSLFQDSHPACWWIAAVMEEAIPVAFSLDYRTEQPLTKRGARKNIKMGDIFDSYVQPRLEQRRASHLPASPAVVVVGSDPGASGAINSSTSSAATTGTPQSATQMAGEEDHDAQPDASSMKGRKRGGDTSTSEKRSQKRRKKN